jgi:hypothetical protein
MASNEIHVGDVGTVFQRTIMDNDVAVDVSAATVKQYIFVRPDGSKLTVSAAFATNGTDGVLQYATVSGDLSMPGQWRLQVYLELPAGKWKSDVGLFDVFANL